MRKTISACAMVYLLFLATSCGSGLESALRKHQGEEAIAGIEGMINEAGVNAANWDNETVMMIAASFGYDDVVKALIKEGADFNAESDSDHTALSFAARNGHIDTVEVLLKEKVNINAINGRALRVASENGWIDVVKLLVKKGADVNVENSQGSTALAVAIVNEHPEIAMYLLDKGADPFRLNYLQTAAEHGYEDVVKNIIKRRGKSDLDEGTALKIWNIALSNATSNGYVDIAEILVKDGADVNSAIRETIYSENIEGLDFLIKSGANVNGGGASEVMSSALFQGNVEVVDMLINAGVDVNLTDEYGNFPLLNAIRSDNRNLEIIQLLLNSGADVNGGDGYGSPIYHIVSDRNHRSQNFEILQMLINSGAILPDNILHVAIDAYKYDSDSITVIETLIKAGANLNFINQWGNAPLHEAIFDYRKDIVQLLIEAGAYMNIVSENGETPLMVAKRWDSEIEELLLAAGATE